MALYLDTNGSDQDASHANNGAPVSSSGDYYSGRISVYYEKVGNAWYDGCMMAYSGNDSSEGEASLQLTAKFDGGDSKTEIHFLAGGWSTTNGRWRTGDIGTGAFAKDTWHHLAWSYDGSSTSNAPIIYLDGSKLSLSTHTTPAGSFPENNLDTCLVGARGHQADNFVEDADIKGRLADAGFWRAVLPESVLKALSLGWSALWWQNNLTDYFPLFSKSRTKTYKGVTLTYYAIPGTDQPHPGLIFPIYGSMVGVPAVGGHVGPLVGRIPLVSKLQGLAA